MFLCHFCEEETVILTNLCSKCRRAKHLYLIYKDDFFNVLEECLVRDKKQQKFKTDKINKKATENKDDLNESFVLYKNKPKEINDKMLTELKEKISKI
jgi:hypothetical protein